MHGCWTSGFRGLGWRPTPRQLPHSPFTIRLRHGVGRDPEHDFIPTLLRAGSRERNFGRDQGCEIIDLSSRDRDDNFNPVGQRVGAGITRRFISRRSRLRASRVFRFFLTLGFS